MALELWLIVILSVLLFLGAAKTHGRQLRLERELHGYMDVQFGSGTNPPWVEGLWRRDRIRFWGFVGVAAPLAAILAALPWLDPLALPLSDVTDRPRLAFGLVGALLWAPTLAFLGLAGLSLRRFLRAARARPEDVAPHPAAWHQGARRGTLFWFTTAGLLALAVILLTFA